MCIRVYLCVLAYSFVHFLLLPHPLPTGLLPLIPQQYAAARSAINPLLANTAWWCCAVVARLNIGQRVGNSNWVAPTQTTTTTAPTLAATITLSANCVGQCYAATGSLRHSQTNTNNDNTSPYTPSVLLLARILFCHTCCLCFHIRGD